MEISNPNFSIFSKYSRFLDYFSIMLSEKSGSEGAIPIRDDILIWLKERIKNGNSKLDARTLKFWQSIVCLRSDKPKTITS